MRVADFDFDLPERLIAQQPAEPRDSARLLVVDRGSGALQHRRVRDLPELLRPGDLLVVNDTRVLPHRLLGRRPSGGRVEALILERRGDAGVGFLKPAAKLRCGQALPMEGGALVLHLERDLGGGRFAFRLEAGEGELEQALERVGRAPLPPYIRRSGAEDAARDRQRYQTVFARAPGAVAAPTAGLHFTPALLEALTQRGVGLARVTLHVGEGTFAPVRVEEVEQHRMHAERFVLPPETAAAIAGVRARRGRVIAVGTTSARTLETCARDDGLVLAGEGTSALFLYPGQRFRVVDGLLTNFHLPRSTLLMLVCALAGRERVLAAYREAVAREYRFFSYGDAMLVVD